MWLSTDVMNAHAIPFNWTVHVRSCQDTPLLSGLHGVHVLLYSRTWIAVVMDKTGHVVVNQIYVSMMQ